MSEGTPNNTEDSKIILSPHESTPREAKEKLKEAVAKLLAKEAKEKLDAKGKLEFALHKLPEIIRSLPNDSRERARVEHTFASVQGALDHLGKDGAPPDKYAVPVEGYEGNPQPAYTQYEGVPVDELINVLRESAKELDKKIPTMDTLAELKREMAQAGEEYMRETEVTGKMLKQSRWAEAEKKYKEAEESLDLGPSEESRELSELADELYKNSQGYFEAHYTKAHGEGGPWTKEEENKQDLRTRHEAKLISLDYRGSKNSDPEQKMKEDYAAGMEVLKYRRELDLLEKEEEKKEEEKPPVVPPTKPEPEPKKPEDTEEPKPEQPPKKPEKKLERITIVDADAQVELMSRKRGAELLNQRLNQESWLKKKWIQIWEPGYRQQYINEERKKILGQENRPGFIRRAMFGANSFEATGKKNLFAGTGAEAQNDPELRDLATRFAEDLQRKSEGELKDQMQDPEFNKRINDLVYEYASGDMSPADFNEKKDALIGEISQKYPKTFAQGGLTADNMLEAAYDFRGMYKHNKGLERMEVNLSVDLGLAKQAIKTEANLNWVDKVVSTSQKYLGPGVSPEAVGFAVAIGSYFARKPLYWLGGAAGLGGLMGAMRKNVEQKRDLEMHRVERAMGAREPGADAPRREAAEKYVYDMRAASDITVEVRELSEDFEANPTKEAGEALTKALAEAEARQSLSETRQGDLISYAGETSLERGRLDLARTLAEAKVALKGKSFELDISKTDEYKNALASLGKEMDKVSKDEKLHRWKENGKAAVVGAIGGLVVGGLAQEAFALIGDHVQALHWLRPGGKATSAETLYHYLKGELPTMPAGAGTQEFYALANAPECKIRVDGTTELIQNKTNGLSYLVDKQDHSRILAQMSVGPDGRVTPVPDSYDPDTIRISSRTVTGGPQTLDEWLSSSKGKLGGNVSEDTWHRTGHGYLDNNTVPKTEFNELRMYMKFDTSGNLTIDASKLQEYMQNAAGEQTQGSKHGSSVLDVAQEYAKGNIKIGIAPDGAHPASVLELKYDPGSHKFVAQSGTDVMRFFGVDAKGNPVLKGDGFMGIAHQLGVRPDGSKNIEWVNSIRGNGEVIQVPDTSRIETEICRKDNGWWGPWIWNFRRKPLEERQKGGYIDETGKYMEFNQEHFEGHGIDDEKDIEKKFGGVKIKDISVDTRGQKIKEDKKDWEGEYPEKFPLQSEREMAEFLVRQGRFFLSLKDMEKYVALSGADRVSFLEGRMKKDREFLETEDGKGFPKERIQEIVDVVLKETDKVFSKYGEKGRSLLPSKERIHIVGDIEYQAQNKLADVGTLGVCFLQSGEIFVNFDAIKYQLFRGDKVDSNLLVSQVKRTIAHEVTHAAVASNYWMFEAESGEKAPAQRRSGLLLRRRQTRTRTSPGESSDQLIVERGRALNEAITEEMAGKVTDGIYKTEKWKPPATMKHPYSPERNILTMIQKKFNIPFDVFAKAAVDRKGLKKLAAALEGKKSKKQGEKSESEKKFMSLLLSVMDSEFMGNNYAYPATKKLIEGKKGIVITKEMKKRFASNLLDEHGGIKKSLVKKYGLIDREAEQMPIAA